VLGGAWWCLVVLGGAWWCLVVLGGAWWCLVVLGGAWYYSNCDFFLYFQDNSDLLKIKYQGIRPAPGYPSQPDHTEKRPMWNLLKSDTEIDLQLSDSLAMMPASAVSALVFGHSEAKYFAVGAIDKDQVQSYSKRKGMELETVERWLAPILNYDDNKESKE
jgi:hypothetical protein